MFDMRIIYFNSNMCIFWKSFAILWLFYTTVSSASLYSEFDGFNYPNSGWSDFGRLGPDLVSNKDNHSLAIVMCDQYNKYVSNVRCNVTVTAHVFEKPKISKTCHFTLSHLNESVHLHDIVLLRDDRVLVHWYEQKARTRMRVHSRVIFMDNCGSSDDYHREYSDTLDIPLMQTARRKDGFVLLYTSTKCPSTLYCVYTSSYDIDGNHLSSDILKPDLYVDGEILAIDAYTLKSKSGEDGPLLVFGTTLFTKYAYSPSFDTKLIKKIDDFYFLNSNGNARIYSEKNSIVNCMKLDKDESVCPGEEPFTMNTANERELHGVYEAPDEGLIILYKLKANNKKLLEMSQRYKNGSSEIVALFEISDKNAIRDGVTILNDKFCYSSVIIETRADYEKSFALEFYTTDKVKFSTTCKTRFEKRLTSDGRTEFRERDAHGELYCISYYTYDGPKVDGVRTVCT